MTNKKTGTFWETRVDYLLSLFLASPDGILSSEDTKTDRLRNWISKGGKKY